MELKFTNKEWLSYKLLALIPLKLIEISDDTTDDYRKKWAAENLERINFKTFIDELKVNKTEDETLIKAPETKYLQKRIISNIKKFENKEIYSTLLQNNNIPAYQNLVNSISSDHRRRGVCMSIDWTKNEDSYLDIFRHAIMICPPSEIQSTFEYLTEQYAEIEKIDSKDETKQKINELRYDFHKSLRQVDPLGNPHAEMIIWSLLQVTDIPHRAIKAVINHVKEFHTN